MNMDKFQILRIALKKATNNTIIWVSASWDIKQNPYSHTCANTDFKFVNLTYLFFELFKRKSTAKGLA